MVTMVATLKVIILKLPKSFIVVTFFELFNRNYFSIFLVAASKHHTIRPWFIDECKEFSIAFSDNNLIKLYACA